MSIRHIALTLIAFAALTASAQDVAPDSMPLSADVTDSIEATATSRPGLIKRLINYFSESNKPKPYRGIDFSIIGGPHYSSDTKLGIGVVAAGFYRHDPADSITEQSNVSLYGDVSTSGFYMVGLRGNHIFKADRNRIDYNLYFYSFPRKFWGIGYDQGIDMANASKFNEIYVNATAYYLHSYLRHLYFGPGLSYHYAHAARMERPELWQGMPLHSSTYGVGVKLQYDTRDNLTATERGILASIEQRFNPKFMGNRQAFSLTELRFCYFHNLWRGGVIAAQYHSLFNYGRVPWSMMATFGGSNSMRGYYDGRFRDKCEMDITVELRQHIWRRNGIVVWGGMGSVFPKISKQIYRHILPNFGVGYRWEFKQRTNVRLDYGWGRGETAFIFSINEAF